MNKRAFQQGFLQRWRLLEKSAGDPPPPPNPPRPVVKAQPVGFGNAAPSLTSPVKNRGLPRMGPLIPGRSPLGAMGAGGLGLQPPALFSTDNDPRMGPGGYEAFERETLAKAQRDFENDPRMGPGGYEAFERETLAKAQRDFENDPRMGPGPVDPEGGSRHSAIQNLR